MDLLLCWSFELFFFSLCLFCLCFLHWLLNDCVWMGATTKVNVYGVVCVTFTSCTSAGSSSGLSVYFSRPAQWWHTWLSFCSGLLFVSSNTFATVHFHFYSEAAVLIGNGFWWGFQSDHKRACVGFSLFLVYLVFVEVAFCFSPFSKVFGRTVLRSWNSFFACLAFTPLWLASYARVFAGASVDFTDIALNDWSTAWIAFLMVAKVAKLAQLTKLAQLAKLAGH